MFCLHRVDYLAYKQSIMCELNEITLRKSIFWERISHTYINTWRVQRRMLIPKRKVKFFGNVSSVVWTECIWVWKRENSIFLFGASMIARMVLHFFNVFDLLGVCKYLYEGIIAWTDLQAHYTLYFKRLVFWKIAKNWNFCIFKWGKFRVEL